MYIPYRLYSTVPLVFQEWWPLGPMGMGVDQAMGQIAAPRSRQSDIAKLGGGGSAGSSTPLSRFEMPRHMFQVPYT
jgi:hypothetical protein